MTPSGGTCGPLPYWPNADYVDGTGSCTTEECVGEYATAFYARMADVAGTVRLPGGSPAGGIGIAAYDEHGTEIGTTTTDPSGRYDFANEPLPPGYATNNWALDLNPFNEDCYPGPCRVTVTAVAYPANQPPRPPDHPSADSVTAESSKKAQLDLVFWSPEDPGTRCKKCSSGPSGGACAVGEPISITTGNMYLDQTDLTLPTLGPDMVFTRAYNSRLAVLNVSGDFGLGWTHPYERRLTVFAGGFSAREADGTPAHYLDRDGDGVYEAWLPRSKDTWIEAQGGEFVRHYRRGGSERYDSQGRLLSIVDSFGNVTTINRDPSTGRLLGVDLPGSRSLAFTHTPQGLIETLAVGVTLIATYTYESNPQPPLQTRLSRVTYADGSGYKFIHLDNLRQITEVRDLTDRVLELHTYAGQMAITSQIGPVNQGVERYTIDYSDPMRPEVRDAFNNPTTYELTSRRGMKLVSRITGPCTSGCGSGGQEIQEWDYDEEGRVTRHRVLRPDESSINETAYEYDPDTGELSSMVKAPGSPDEQITLYTSDPATGLRTSVSVPSVVDSYFPVEGKVTRYAYTNDQVHTITETGLLAGAVPYSYVTTYEYTPQGKLQSVDGPRTDVQDVTSYDYDPSTGDLRSVTQPLVGATTYSNFTALGRPQTVTDPNQVATTYVYDPMGRVSTMTVAGHTTGYDYNPTGKLKRVDLPRGNSLHYDYDNYDRLWKIRDHYGNYVEYTYDEMSRRRKEQIKDSSGALQKELTFEYDAFHRLKKIINPDLAASYTEYTYDAAGNRKTARNPRTFTTTYEYDGLNRLKQVKQPPDASILTEYTYNIHDDLASVKDAEQHLTRYYHDDMARVFREESPDTGTTTYEYDAAGNRTKKTDARGVTVEYSYDALNRLTRVHFVPPPPPNVPAHPDITYTYDTGCPYSKGRLCQVIDQAGTTSYAYNTKGELIEERKTIEGHTYVTSYQYDPNGNLGTITYPSGRTVTYTPDMADRVSLVTTTPPGGSAQTLASNILYKPFGGIREMTYGNGLLRSVGYDNQYRIGSIESGSLQNLSYVHDANGNIEYLNNLLDPGRNKILRYDKLDRLESANGSWGSLTWAYDDVGNRETYVQPEGTATYGYQPGTNRLLTVSGPNPKTFGYDANGNITTENSRVYTYNQNNRLVEVTDGASVAAYGHYANGQRATKTVGGTTTVFQYDGSVLLAENVASGALVTEYIYLGGQPLAKVQGGTLTYIHPDHLGTPVLMTTSTTPASAVWDIEARPFGDGSAITGSGTLNLRFPGQYFDQETGLHQNWWREYHPVIGRYLPPDPAGLAGGINRYLYASANPVNLRDPFGLCSCKDPCPSGNWIVDIYSVTIGAGFATQFGFGKISCSDDYHVSRWAKVGCVLIGLFLAVEAGADFQIQGTTISGPCKPDDLKRTHVNGWVFDVGSVDFTTGPSGGFPDFFGLSVGPSGGAAYVDCYITPL